MARITGKSKARNRPDKSASRDSLRPAAVWILLLGVVCLAIWYVTNDGSMMSMLLALAAISTITLAVLLYFLTPSKSLRAEVCDAMAISSTLEIRKILSSLYVESKGIYVPASLAGSTKVFIPLLSGTSDEMLTMTNLNTSDKIFFFPEKGVKGMILSPPGSGLYHYVQSIGAQFTKADLENEITDVLENTLELAENVSVKVDGNRVNVTLKKIVNHEICATVRREDPTICFQTGCPICSSVGCMVVNGMGKMATVENIHVDGKTINLEYRLIGE